MATWKKVLVEGDVASDFRILDDESARDSVASADRKQGYLAYLKSEKELCVYNSASIDNTNWELDSNWLQIPHTTDDYDAVTLTEIIEADNNDYQWQLYDTVNDTYKKLDINELGGLITQLLAQSLIDQGVGTSGTYTGTGSDILGDLDGDGDVDVNDMLLFLGIFGSGNTADFDVNWQTDFVADGDAISLLEGDGYTNGTYTTLQFSSGDISQSATGFDYGFNDSGDYLLIEDGTNHTVYSNILQTGTGQMYFDITVACTNTMASPDYITLKMTFWRTLNGAQVGSSSSTSFGGVGVSSFAVSPSAVNEEHSVSYNFKPDVQAFVNSFSYDPDNPNFDGIAFRIEALSVLGQISSIKIKSGSQGYCSN